MEIKEQSDDVCIEVASVPFWKKKWVRFIIWLCTGLLSLVLFIWLLPIILGFFVRDIRSVDDGDIVPSRLTTPTEHNAYFDLIAIEGKIQDPMSMSRWHAEPNSSVLQDQFANSMFMENWLKENANVFHYFDAAAEKQFFQEPYTSDPEKINSMMVLPSLSTWRQASRLQAVRAEYLASKGQHSEAMGVAMSGLSVGKLITESAQPTLITYLVGLAQKKIALTAIERVGASSTLSRNNFRAYINKLENAKNNTSGLVGAFRTEYQLQKNGIAMIASFTEFTGEIPANIYVSRSYYFQPNKTIELIAAISRKAILDANQPCTTKPIEDKTHGQNVWPDSGLKYLENNTIGKLIVRSAFIDTSSVFNKRCSDLSLISAVQLLLALKAYTNEEGELPKTLELLVPEYIAQIPEDPFAGRPLSYSAEKKIIYSIGVNRIDDGGVVQKYEETWNSMKDQVIKIPF